MKKEQLGWGSYSSPKVRVLELLSESILCTSQTMVLQAETGVTWYENKIDAEW